MDREIGKEVGVMGEQRDKEKEGVCGEGGVTINYLKFELELDFHLGLIPRYFC